MKSVPQAFRLAPEGFLFVSWNSSPVTIEGHSGPQEEPEQALKRPEPLPDVTQAGAPYFLKKGGQLFNYGSGCFRSAIT